MTHPTDWASSLSDFGLDFSYNRAMSNFVECDREQAFLLPPDLRDWLPADDLGHFVIEAVERVDLSAFKVNHRGTGSAQYHPRMMLALMINCYANGIFSSRRIERATHRDIGVRFVAATRDGTATAGADYTATSGTLTFTVGQRSKTVRVPILDDSHDDGETFTLVLSDAAERHLTAGP